MKIRLNEIPSEGRSYTFDRESAELDQDLKDLVGDRPYLVEMNINPIGNAYEMRGQFKTTLQETCSKCAYEFDLAVERSFHEILFEEQPDHRKSHSVHGNQSVDFEGTGSPSMTTVKGDVFDPGAFAHEAIALAEPLYPMCGPNDTCLRSEEVDRIRAKL